MHVAPTYALQMRLAQMHIAPQANVVVLRGTKFNVC